MTINAKLDNLLFNNIRNVGNTRNSFVYFCTCHVAWSRLTKTSSQVFYLLLCRQGWSRSLSLCVCATSLVLLEVNDFLCSLQICWVRYIVIKNMFYIQCQYFFFNLQNIFPRIKNRFNNLLKVLFLNLRRILRRYPRSEKLMQCTISNFHFFCQTSDGSYVDLRTKP